MKQFLSNIFYFLTCEKKTPTLHIFLLTVKLQYWKKDAFYIAIKLKAY